MDAVLKNIDIARKYFIGAAQNEIPMAQYELGKIFLANRQAGDRDGKNLLNQSGR